MADKVIVNPDPEAHTFNDTGAAYDASQCDDGIKNGDILLATKEHVIGFLVDAWPVALTEAHGAFHHFQDDCDPRCWEAIGGGKPATDYSPSIKKAVALARRHGWRLESRWRDE